MILFFLLVIFLIIAILIISSLTLWGLSRLFKIQESSFKLSLIITFIYSIVGGIISIPFKFILPYLFGEIVSIVLTYFIFLFLLKKYYQVSWKKSLMVYVVYSVFVILITFSIVVSTRLFLFAPFVVAGKAMTPNFNEGNYLIIKKFGNDYVRDDVIVFKSIYNTNFIKRIVGLPLEKVEIKNGQLFINDSLVQDEYISNPIPGDLNVSLKAGEYFVLGDNSSNSLDSRKLGPININDIVGKVIINFK